MTATRPGSLVLRWKVAWILAINRSSPESDDLGNRMAR